MYMESKASALEAIAKAKALDSNETINSIKEKNSMTKNRELARRLD